MHDLLGLGQCRFEAPPNLIALATVERNGTVTGTPVRHYAHGELELPREGAELPVLARGQQIGRFVLEPEPGAGVSLEAHGRRGHRRPGRCRVDECAAMARAQPTS